MGQVRLLIVSMCHVRMQAVLAESEAKRSRHLQDLEGIRASREAVEAQLAHAQAKLRATQAALAQVDRSPSDA